MTSRALLLTGLLIACGCSSQPSDDGNACPTLAQCCATITGANQAACLRVLEADESASCSSGTAIFCLAPREDAVAPPLLDAGPRPADARAEGQAPLPDATPALDARAPLDATSPLDVATPLDAATPLDTGSPVDAAKSAPDSAVPVDAHGDAGTSPSFDSSVEAATTLVLFGGRDAMYNARGDTWIFAGGGWQPFATPASPPSRGSHGMATLASKAVVFGGCSDLYCDVYLGDTWTFDGSAWTEVPTPTAPSARVAPQMAARGSSVVLYGGCNGQYCETTLTDTWTFDGLHWTPVTTAHSPPMRTGGTLVSWGARVLLFGGCGPATSETFCDSLDDSWAFDGIDWTQLTPSVSPPPRAGAAMANAGGSIVLYGGELWDQSSELSKPLTDTWTLDPAGTRWTEVASVESPGSYPFVAMGALGGSAVLVESSAGGTAGTGTAIWRLSGTTWTSDSAGVEPTGRTETALAAVP